MKAVRKKVGQQLGSTTVEAMGLILVLLAALVLIVIIGAGYWNSSLLNSTASSAALAGQTLVNTDCSLTKNNPACTARAKAVMNEITCSVNNLSSNCASFKTADGAQNQLLFTNNANLPANIDVKAPSCNAQTPPASVSGSVPKGWGYAFVQMNSKFRPIGVPQSSAINLRASSMASGYQSTAFPNCPKTP